ncbi:hypothetical protein [Roseovarius nubinhibens]|uniref:hypothetical protein n=1 Tax=Roseovarius nubinhibens TaxID=314263 RepID=UPI001C07F652|nr:hypothetical protein [Roseovarius nubinhibens]
MKYSFLRVFALEVDVPPILLATGDAPEKRTRAQYLKDVFSNRIEFEHWGKGLIYIPISVDDLPDGAVCSGRIGAQKRESVNASPEELFEPEIVTSWRAANFLIDTRNYNDGQKIAMQHRADVGKPLSILNSLVRHINEVNVDSGWELAVNAITEKTTFWEAVGEFEGQITRAEFSYATPNVLGLRSKINKRLKGYKDAENANRVKVILENEKGALNLNSQEVKDAVEYTSEGGGSTKLKVGAQIVYDSEDDEKAVTFETDDQLGLEQADARKGIIDRLFKK